MTLVAVSALDHLGHQRHAALAVGRLLRDSDPHAAVQRIDCRRRDGRAAAADPRRSADVDGASTTAVARRPPASGRRACPEFGYRRGRGGCRTRAPMAVCRRVRARRLAGAVGSADGAPPTGADGAAAVRRGRGVPRAGGGPGPARPARPAAAACPPGPSAPRRSPTPASGSLPRRSGVRRRGRSATAGRPVAKATRRGAARPGDTRRRPAPAPPRRSTGRWMPVPAPGKAAVAVLVAAQVGDRPRPRGSRRRTRPAPRARRRCRRCRSRRRPRAKLKPPSESCWRTSQA